MAIYLVMSTAVGLWLLLCIYAGSTVGLGLLKAKVSVGAPAVVTTFTESTY